MDENNMTNETENTADTSPTSESTTDSSEKAAPPIVSAFEMNDNNTSSTGASYHTSADTASSPNAPVSADSYPSFEATDSNPEISRGFGIASLVMGILSILCCCGVGALFSIPGIIFGCIQQRDAYGQKPGQAIAGIITSCIGLLLNAFLILCLLMFGFRTF